MPAGRPTDYDEELIITVANEYLDNYQEHGDMIPSIEGLVASLGIARSTAYRWRDEEGKEVFKDILERVLEKQQRVLINKGLSNEFNSAITKLALGKHGYSDSKQITGADGKDLIPSEVIITHE